MERKLTRAEMEEVFAYADADNRLEGKTNSEFFESVIRPGLLDGKITPDAARNLIDGYHSDRARAMELGDIMKRTVTRAEREQVCAEAEASLRPEGLNISEFCQGFKARLLDGAITPEQMIAKIDAHYREQARAQPSARSCRDADFAGTTG